MSTWQIKIGFRKVNNASQKKLQNHINEIKDSNG